MSFVFKLFVLNRLILYAKIFPILSLVFDFVSYSILLCPWEKREAKREVKCNSNASQYLTIA